MKRKHTGRWIVVQNHELDVPILEVLAERGTAHVGVIRSELEKKCVFGKYMMEPHKNNHFRWQYLTNVRLDVIIKLERLSARAAYDPDRQSEDDDPPVQGHAGRCGRIPSAARVADDRRRQQQDRTGQQRPVTLEEQPCVVPALLVPG